KGRLDIVLKIDEGTLEAEGGRGTGASVSATVLSIPDRATKEHSEAQRCLSRRDSARAVAHLRRAVEIAPQFTAAWNQLGMLAYQARQYADAEANFRRALEADPDAFERVRDVKVIGGVVMQREPRPSSPQTFRCGGSSGAR
ncbi:MAG TPA: tetratricopeptide repeat protein, partial [Rhizomicrobium sp.]